MRGRQVASSRGLRLGSPAPNPCGSNCNTFSDPFQWWDAWQVACNQMYGRDCHADFYASHFYSCDTQAISGRACAAALRRTCAAHTSSPGLLPMLGTRRPRP